MDYRLDSNTFSYCKPSLEIFERDHTHQLISDDFQLLWATHAEQIILLLRNGN